jgi:ornithine carbamoyltransferase
MKSFLSITDFDTAELNGILDRADALYSLWHDNAMPRSLRDMRVALWFWGNGFRNRVAFELGARAMGADVSFIPGELGVHEPLEDMGHYLDNWFDLAVVRCKSHDDLMALHAATDMPIVNARTSFNHPCEIMGDLQFIRRKRGSLEGLNVVFVGEVTNLCMSWLEAAVRFPISVTQAAPRGFLLDSAVARAMAADARGRISTSTDLQAAVGPDVDVIYTDCWPKETHKEEIARIFLPYQITADVLKKMNPQGFFLPCPPVSRGQEVSMDAMQSPLCMNHPAKEFLLHAQNAIMEHLAEARDPR